jgi:hypothetical protein
MYNENFAFVNASFEFTFVDTTQSTGRAALSQSLLRYHEVATILETKSALMENPPTSFLDALFWRGRLEVLDQVLERDPQAKHGRVRAHSGTA